MGRMDPSSRSRLDAERETSEDDSCNLGECSLEWLSTELSEFFRSRIAQMFQIDPANEDAVTAAMRDYTEAWGGKRADGFWRAAASLGLKTGPLKSDKLPEAVLNLLEERVPLAKTILEHIGGRLSFLLNIDAQEKAALREVTRQYVEVCGGGRGDIGKALEKALHGVTPYEYQWPNIVEPAQEISDFLERNTRPLTGAALEKANERAQEYARVAIERVSRTRNRTI